MKNKTTVIVCLVIALLLNHKYSQAQFSFKNNCNTPVGLAFKYLPFPNSPYWVVSGWFTIQPGGTQLVLSNPLINRYFYFYARSGDNFTWSGYANTCVNDNGFERREYNNQNACLLGDYILPFQQIDVGGYSSYTFPLNCPGSEYQSAYREPSNQNRNSYEKPRPVAPQKPKPVAPKKPKYNPDETFAYFKKSTKFKCELAYEGECGFFGTHSYLQNNDSYNSYRVTVRTTTDEYNSGSSDWKYIVNAGEKVSVGCTRADGAGAKKYYFEIVGEEKWNR